MWDGGKNGQKGDFPTWRTLKNARRSPAGIFWHSKMLAGVPLAFFCPQKCSPGSRWRFFALKNARRGPAGIFWHSKMLAGVPLAFFGTQKCWRLSRGHFLALRNTGDRCAGIYFSKIISTSPFYRGCGYIKCAVSKFTGRQ